jgi:hypothetical protein
LWGEYIAFIMIFPKRLINLQSRELLSTQF